MKRWAIIAVVVAIGYYLWKKERAARNAAEARVDKSAGSMIGSDPISQAKAAADSMIEKANLIAAAVRKDPGLAGLVGLSKVDSDRLMLSPDSFAKIYNQIPTTGFDIVR